VIASGVGTILMVIPFFLAAPFFVGLYYGEDTALAALAYLLPALFSLLLGFVMRHPGRRDLREIRPGESLVVVAISWLLIGVVGALPFSIMNTLPTFIDCVFESISGFTTTGSSVIRVIDGLPRSILFWRSLIQWVGGMGIVVLMVAILSILVGGPKAGFMLMKGEVPGHSKEKILPRVKDTAKAVWLVYVVLTVAEVLLLTALGLSLYDAVCHTFTTLSTGGFSTHTASIGHYSGRTLGPLIEVVISVFMMLGSVNFVLHYNLFKGNLKGYIRDPEFRTFMLIWAAAVVMIALDLFLSGREGPLESLRLSSFHVSSIITTTGYATDDFDAWSPLARFLIFVLMLNGGMTNSTAGAIKVARLMIASKALSRTLRGMGHRRAIIPLRIGSTVIPDNIVRGVCVFIFGYIGLILVGSFLMSLTGLDAISSISSVFATLGCVGPGLGSVGPSLNFAHVTPAGKVILSLLMWLGRLEIMTCLVMFIPSSWRS